MPSEFEQIVQQLFQESVSDVQNGPKLPAPLALREVVKGWIDRIEAAFPRGEFEETIAAVLCPLKAEAAKDTEGTIKELAWHMERLLDERRNLKRIVAGAADAMAPFQGQIPDPTPILQGALMESLVSEIAALPPEQRAERLERIKARAAESQRRSEEFAREVEAKEQARQLERIAKEEGWRRRSFRWMLEPVPMWDEDTEEVAPGDMGVTPEQVEAIRARAFEWEAGDHRQKLPAFLFDHLSEMNMDWESIVRWENGMALAFLHNKSAPEGAFNVW